MHQHCTTRLSHEHNYGIADSTNEKKTLYVILLTFVTMAIEIGTGILTGSMALLADGWHMGTHVFALGITFFAYVMARRCAGSARYSFGTGKFGILAGYTSALFLGCTAGYMMYESLLRFISPVPIAFNEAIVVAVAGLIVNVASLWILHGGDDHAHHHDHKHEQGHKHDHNLRAAYLHVAADALTSVLAILALFAGKHFGLIVLDPVMGVVGGVLIARWAWPLLKSSADILLDGHNDMDIQDSIVTAIQSDKDSRVADLHVWHLNSNELATIVSVVSTKQRTPSYYHERLSSVKSLRHLTVETHLCVDKQYS